MSHHLITGDAGFMGSALARRLLAEGHDVTILDRFSRGKQGRVPKEARTIACDIRSPEPVANAIRDAEVVWHLAYIQGTQTFYAEPAAVIDVALTGIMNVLNACAGQEFFLVSSSEVYQDPPSYPTDETVPLVVPDVTNSRYSYGAGKIASEVATLAYAHAGVFKRAVIVRPHNVYGPDMGSDHVIPQFAMRMAALEGSEFPIQGTGEETRCFCHIDDCIDGLMVLLEKGEDRNVYHLGDNSEEITMRDLAHLIAQWFGRDITVVPGELPKGSPVRRLPDILKMQHLGYQPKVWLTDGLNDTLLWYRDQVTA